MALTVGVVRWHVEYFRSPGPQVYRAALIALPVLSIAALVWTRVRTRFLWRYEPAVIVAIPVVAVVLREPRAAVVVAILFAACYCAGRALRDRFGWTTEGPAADLVISTAAGLALLNTALFASGLTRLWYPWFFGLILLASILIFRRNLPQLVHSVRALFRRWGESKELQGPLTGILIPFAAILALCTTATTLAPTLSWDAMKMHLPLARYYLDVHALAPKPDLTYSFFPQATESIFALAWSLGGQPAAQLIPPLFFLLTLLALWVLARDCASDAYEAMAGVVFAASLPVIHWSESVPKNDAALTFFLLSSLIAALRWRATSDFKWAQAGVLFLACGFATKDLALLGAFSLGGVFLYAAWRRPNRLRAVGSLAAIFTVFALIWSVRRFLLTGNPIFPLVPGQSMVPGWPPDPSLTGTVLRLLRLPWDLHVHGHDFSETVLIAPLGIAFVIFWPVWLLATRRLESAARLCLGFAITAFLLWGLLSPLIRYAVPALAVMALLTGIRVARFSRTSPIVQASLVLACLWILIPAVCAAMIVEINLPQVRYLTGAIGRDAYLTQTTVTYAPLAWLRDHTTSEERILGLENCSDIYAPPFPRYRSVCAFRPWTAPEIESQLSTASFDWLLAPSANQPGRPAVEMYRDPNFVIYRLTR